MATLDQLPAEQRAIVELVVQRGRSYDALADVLQVTPDRVRDLARDALTELSPRTAARVDPDWRGRVADYLLGQQSSAESRETRTHLKESESSRAWALSLLDSLDPLYGDGGAPPVPEPVEADAPAGAETAPRRERARASAAGGTVEERARERARKPADAERKREPLRKQADDDEDDRPRSRDRDAGERPRARGSLSPAAQTALRRRRILGIVGGVVALAAVVVAILAIAGVFSGDDDKGDKSGKSGTSTTPAGQQPLQVLGQITLNPIGKSNAQGIAYIVQQNGKRSVVVQARVPPLPDTQKVAAYEVWLYNSNGDARSLGAQYTDARGVLQGRADLPTNFTKYKSLDISRELFSDKNAGHGKSSVLRGAFASLAPVPQQQQQGGAGGAQQQPGAGGAAPQQPGAGQQPGATQPAP